MTRIVGESVDICAHCGCIFKERKAKRPVKCNIDGTKIECDLCVDCRDRLYGMIQEYAGHGIVEFNMKLSRIKRLMEEEE